MRHVAVLTTAFLLLASGTAAADYSKKVTASFKGQLIVSDAELPVGKDDKATIGDIKKAKRAELKGEPNGDGVTAWRFHYTAFLGKPATATLRLKFFTADKGQFAADQGLSGVDAKASVLAGDISITEDEGLTKGKAYVVKLVNANDVVLAQTPLTVN